MDDQVFRVRSRFQALADEIVAAIRLGDSAAAAVAFSQLARTYAALVRCEADQACAALRELKSHLEGPGGATTVPPRGEE